MRRILLAVLVLAIIVAGVAGWYLSAPVVTLATPVRDLAVQAVFATGNVEPVTWAKVTPMVRGRIEEQCRCEGRTVKRGEVLARLEDREARAQVSELEARERFLKEEVERYRSLLTRSVVSTAAYDRILSDYMQVGASIAAARERLAHYTLEAPIDGTVLRRDGEVGEIVAPGDVIFWVGQPKPLWIVAEVDEEDIPDVRPGQETLIKSDAFPDRVLKGTVHQITPKGDPVNKSYRVRIMLPDDTPLLIGMTTEVNIVIRAVENALLVPASSLVKEQVWLLEDGKAAVRPVKVGIRGHRQVQILDGIEEGVSVIADPPRGLEAGTRVRVGG